MQEEGKESNEASYGLQDQKEPTGTTGKLDNQIENSSENSEGSCTLQ